MIASLFRMFLDIDVRDLLPVVRVPTLVVHRRGDRLVNVRAGRWLAEHLPDARFVELPGTDHNYWYDAADSLIGEIEEFLTGTRRQSPADRVLLTVLFTDIVESTRKASDAGDRRWHDLLDDHHRMVREQLDRHRGKEVKTTGDGFLATFDGPARGIRCAQAIVAGSDGLGLEVRAGLHTGECEVMGDDIAGIAVNIAARVSALAGPRQVLVSRTVKDLVAGSGLEFTDRGMQTLKGIPDSWQLFALRT
jgi:class 3 adenylate cyclase